MDKLGSYFTDMKANNMPAEDEPVESAQARLGLWDTVSIILGIVVGVSIFKSPPLIFNNVHSPIYGLAAWLLGGLLALVGGLCYAELATTYPRSGGDYVYLSRAYGRWAGFLFGWAQLVAILSGSIGAMAYVFADYAIDVFGFRHQTSVAFAVAAPLVLTLINCFGILAGKTAQNVLTAAKVLGVGVVLLTGLFVGSAARPFDVERPMGESGFGLAMVFVLYTYGGWNDAAFVTAEVRQRQRNIPRALIVGISSIVLLYMLMNIAYLKALGFEGLRASRTPAADVLKLSVGPGASRVVSLLVMTSALGAINGMILTGSRVYAALGEDHPLFGWLGRWSAKSGTPLWSLLTQAAVASLMIASIGTSVGRTTIDIAFQKLGTTPLDWTQYGGGFGTLVTAMSPVFWLFFLMTGVSLFVLRATDRVVDRPFKVPLYPLPPLLFCGMCGYMLWSSVAYAGRLSLLGLMPLASGLPLYWLSRRCRLNSCSDRNHTEKS